MTPTLGSTSLAGDVASVDAVLNQMPGKKILVGHSYKPIMSPAVLVLGLVSPPREGLTLGSIASYTLLLAAVALVDQTGL